MKTYNKIYEYKNYKFNIKIELDAVVERRPNGKREHLITINDMGVTNFYEKTHCESHNLEESIKNMIDYATKWVDEKTVENKTPDEILLESLGFTK